MEATKVFTSAYLEQLILNATNNSLPISCPEGCNPKQFIKVARHITEQLDANITYRFDGDPTKIKITP